jgi:hypothetical protein
MTARAQCYRCGMARRPEDPSWWWENPFLHPPYNRHVEDHYCIEALGRTVQELQQQVAALVRSAERTDAC